MRQPSGGTILIRIAEEEFTCLDGPGLPTLIGTTLDDGCSWQILLQKSAIGRGAATRRGRRSRAIAVRPEGRWLRRAETNARDAYATHAVARGGGLTTNFASRSGLLHRQRPLG